MAATPKSSYRRDRRDRREILFWILKFERCEFTSNPKEFPPDLLALLLKLLAGGCPPRDSLTDRHPLLRFGRLEDRVGDVVGGETIPEGRRQRLAAGGGLDEVRELVDERVLVADLQAGHPPVLHVGLIAVGDVDAAPAADAALVVVIEVLQPVQVVQVPAG